MGINTGKNNSGNKSVKGTMEAAYDAAKNRNPKPSITEADLAAAEAELAVLRKQAEAGELSPTDLHVLNSVTSHLDYATEEAQPTSAQETVETSPQQVVASPTAQVVPKSATPFPTTTVSTTNIQDIIMNTQTTTIGASSSATVAAMAPDAVQAAAPNAVAGIVLPQQQPITDPAAVTAGHRAAAAAINTTSAIDAIKMRMTTAANQSTMETMATPAVQAAINIQAKVNQSSENVKNSFMTARDPLASPQDVETAGANLIIEVSNTIMTQVGASMLSNLVPINSRIATLENEVATIGVQQQVQAHLLDSTIARVEALERAQIAAANAPKATASKEPEGALDQTLDIIKTTGSYAGFGLGLLTIGGLLTGNIKMNRE